MLVPNRSPSTPDYSSSWSRRRHLVRHEAARRSASLVELMVRYCAGEEHVFSALYRSMAPRIRRQLQAVIGQDSQLEDLVQDTFLKIHSGREHFRVDKVRDDSGVIAWYCTIARNTGINELRRRCGKRGPLGSWHESEDTLPCTQPDAEHIALAAELHLEVRRRVHASLRALPDSLRSVVEMHKLRGIPIPDIARQLGIRPGTARVRAHRGYRSMAQELRSFEEPGE